MKSGRRRVFLTGATGYMGRAGLDALLEREDRFEIVALVLPTANDRRIMAPYLKQGVEVVWGDLTRYEDVLAGVRGADVVLHVGGMVSPLADAHPKRTMKVNVGAAKNLVRAIHAQPEPDRIRLVYIGSVAQTGNRPAPIHWGRVGDPIKISVFDTYAWSKTIAERIVIDSGLPTWVSLRQTGIARLSAADSLDPIMFHTPLDGVLEWITARDSGVLLANVSEEDVPKNFWRHVYNIGGGKPNRLTNLEYFERMLSAIGVKDPRCVVEPHWFAQRNFHGHWFSDSDRLEEMLSFRTQTLDEYLSEEAERLPWSVKLGSLFPQLIRRRFERIALGPGGTLNWLAESDEPRIKAFFKSELSLSPTRGWEEVTKSRPSAKPSLLDHAYDESRARSTITRREIQAAARFRGGECFSDEYDGDWRTILRWRCHAGHEFNASLNLVLMAGHWCPTCIGNPLSYPDLARHSPFFNQVWAPDDSAQDRTGDEVTGRRSS
ncbi:MAG: NAD(P)-dependent oxidoreductase [Anaerolineales bacterium]